MQKPVHEKIETLPRNPGVYLFKNKQNQVIYIGKAKVLVNRVRSYFQNIYTDKTNRLRYLQRSIYDVEFFITDTEQEALLLENNLIKKHNPYFNVRLKDGKTYPYICIKNEPFPQILITRKVIQDGSKYIGPYTNIHDIRSALRSIRKLFQIRTCTFSMTESSIAQKKHRVCLDYHIKRCAGPCEGLQSSEDYKKNVSYAESFLNGHQTKLKAQLTKQMFYASQKQLFEQALRIRDILQQLDFLDKKQQKVEHIKNVAQDYIGIVSEDQDVTISVLKVREGKVIGKQDIVMSNTAFDNMEVIFERFLHHFYMNQTPVSDECFIPRDASSDIIMHQEYFQKLTKSSIKFFQPQLGKKAKMLRMATLNAKQRLNELRLNKLKKDYTPQALKSLKRDLNLPTIPIHIECFDNSNTQGSDAVSSLVVFIKGVPKKSEYRKFKIKTLIDGEINDFASMYEVVFRRYKRLKEEGQKMPHLIMVDGGKGQLSAAIRALKDLKLFPTPIIGLAKKLEEVFLPFKIEPQNIPKTSSAMKLLQKLRDESHRFAITYHRKIRRKRILSSELETIQGIGKKRQQLLLTHFGSVQKIKSASLEDLKKVKRIPKNVAKIIFDIFQKKQ